MNTSVAKWGNSLGIRLPRNLASDAEIYEGTKVDISLIDSALVIRPQKKKIELADLLRDYDANSDRDEEFDFGAPIGDEIW